MSDFQEARAKRVEFSALQSERELAALQAGLIAHEDVEGALIAAEDLLRLLAAGWARTAAARISALDEVDLAEIHAILEISAADLLERFSADLAALGESS